jgi:NDP-sugar pyrophosphorylase family protein
VIVGPTVIGPGARITDSYIGPYTSIGECACVERAEVERSIISPGASVMHVGGRLVASIVGRDAPVFRDFSLPCACESATGLRLRSSDLPLLSSVIERAHPGPPSSINAARSNSATSPGPRSCARR